MRTSSHLYTSINRWDKPLDASWNSAQTLILVFATARPNKELKNELEKLHHQFSESIILGCSSAGEIHGSELHDNSIVVAITQFSKTELRVVDTVITDSDQSAAAGHQIAEQLLGDDLVAVFTLTDGQMVNGSTYVEALNKTLPKNTIVTGGMAADGNRFEQTWLIHNDSIQSGKIAAVGFYGESVKVAHGSGGGWGLFGPDREVTHAIGNVLYSLDDQPALDIYKKYLGDRADGLPATGLYFPLGIRNEHDENNLTVRTILAVDEKEKSITFAGDLQQGSVVRFMRANYDRLVDGAALAAEEVDLTEHIDSPVLCIAISCVGRRLVLGQRTEEELEAVKDSFANNTSLIGYYSYGEISPLNSGRCDLHNQTMTITAIWE